MNVPFYTPVREYENNKKLFDEAVQSVMQKGNFILGEEVKILEEEIKKFTGAKHAISVASGSDALVICSDILDFCGGSEVLTPAFTFFASASCIARLGGKPVFVDIDEKTLCMDFNDAQKRVTKKTAGIIPVHLFSQMVDMTKCKEFASTYNLKILEDAAEAFGMKQRIRIGGQEKYLDAGTIGDFGIYSFFPTKTLGAFGDAGMIVTNNDELASKANAYRVHGSTKKYFHDYIGYNSRLDTIQAAILLVKIKNIEKAIIARERIAKLYDSLLSNLIEKEYIKLPEIISINKPVFYVYNIIVKDRDKLVEFLKEKGIGTSIYYPLPLHLQKCFTYLGYKKGDFPVSEKIAESILALPIFPELTEKEVEYVCDNIKKFYKI
jgi:dTDP-4-amino-4,6-dideoxygalactose transaminase